MMLAALLVLGVYRAPEFLCGGDVSEIAQVERAGGVYRYKGKVEDPFQIMKDAGWNWVRFRIWNNPKDGECNKEYTLALAKRAVAHGLKFSLDFHYSDWWADPGKQYVPAAWKGMGLDDLSKALYDYTKDVVSAMVKQGTVPNMVQIGNEILSGMCWPVGQLKGEDETQWSNLATLLKSGIQAVHDAEGHHHIQTMIHLDRGGDNKGARWWFDHIGKYNVGFDLIGLSYYTYWHGPLAGLQPNVQDLAQRYHKPVYVVETAYPWTDGNRQPRLEPGFTATPEGQAAFVSKVRELIRDAGTGMPTGLLYWAPTWIPSPKFPSGWGVNATFDYDGNALPAVDALSAKMK